MLVRSENETELSFFNRAAYEAFKANPEVSVSAQPRNRAADAVTGQVGLSFVSIGEQDTRDVI